MHNIIYRTYSDTASTSAIEREVINIVQSSGDRYGTDRVKFIHNPIFDNEEKARDYISEIDHDFYGGYAVKFYDYSEAKNTKKIDELEEKIKETQKKKSEYVSAHNVKDYKSSYIGCSKCGSKISREHLSGNFCPVCRTDLRSESTLERIAGFDKRIKDYREKIQQEKQKQKKNAKIKWFVKFEYHSER